MERKPEALLPSVCIPFNPHTERKEQLKIYGEAEQIKTYSRKSFAKDHPELAKFFSKLHFDDKNMSDLLMKMEQSKNKEATAKEWVEDHAELVQSWLDKN